MSSGLYSGVSGLALGAGLYKSVSGMWSGASGLVAGFGGGPDFSLTLTSTGTAWGASQLGVFTIQDAPPGSFIVLVETTDAIGDEAGFAVVNG